MKKTSLLSEELEILLGGLLGDSFIHKNNKYTIGVRHSEKQYEYLNWKHNKLNRISRNITKSIVNDKYIEYSFETLSKFSDDIKAIDLLVKKENKKTVTRKWLNMLTPLSLAIWWMDDGCLSIHKGNRYGKLCTHSFSYEEHLIIQKYFKVKWNIKIDIKVEKRKYYFCRLNVENLKKLITIIYPYIIQVPSMIYKIDLNYINDVKLKDFEEIYYIIKSYKK